MQGEPEPSFRRGRKYSAQSCQKLLQTVLMSGVFAFARDPSSLGDQRGFGVLFLKALFL